MCFSVKCGSCEKTSWSGCGRHVESVYKQIPEGQHCSCKDWPGVKITAAVDASSTADAPNVVEGGKQSGTEGTAAV